MIARTTVLRRNPEHVSAPLEESLVMMDIDAGKYYLLNGVAPLIWDRLAEPTPVADIVDDLCGRYEVTPEQCEADVLPFLTQLHEKGLVEQA